MKKHYNLDFETPWPTLVIYYDEFLQTRLEELAEIKNAFINRDLKVIDEFAHKWKGFANPYGFGVLGQMAIELEEAIKLQDLESTQDLMNEIEIYLNSKKPS